jgi:eukaryotic-like serine/threonine-protein kinase
VALGTVAPLVNIRLAGRYAITREIGRGGMATVYLARDLRDDRDVAVKVLLPEVGVALGAERFRREITVASRFSHPRILPLYDSGEHEGQLYYVMPFVGGESLRAKLDREGPLAIDEAVQYAAEAADALDYAHEQGIVHRDIKPENILLEDGHALVVDFGIARAAAELGGEKLTQTGITLGTPQYMSPEQGTADPSIGRRSDIYSLGCVLYEMLAGHPPFSGTSAQAVIARHALDQVPPLTTVRPTVPASLEVVVLKALAKVPADRFQTAHEFAEALRHPDPAQIARWTTTHRAPSSATVGTPVKARGFDRRWGLAGLAAAFVAGAVGWTIWRGGHQGTAPSAAGPDARKIAVLYFDDLTPTHSLGYVADGLTGSLIDELSQVRSLSLISRGGVEAFKGRAIRSDSIARVLQVGTLVRGTVEPEGNQLRVTVRLVDAASGADFDRFSFEQPAADVLVLKDTLAAHVATMIRRRLGEEIQVRTERDATKNADAWALVQRAAQRRQDGERLMPSNDTTGVLTAFREADSMLVQAHALDGQWAEPEIDRALINYRASRFFGDRPLRAAPWIDSGVVHAVRALALSPSNATAFELRGTLRYWRYLLNLEPDSKRADDSLRVAQADLEQATKLNPAQAGAWAALSHLYAVKLDMTESKLAARRAYEEDAYLSNADLVLWRLFGTSYDLEQLVEASHWCDVGQHRFPGEPRFAECRLRLLATSVVPAYIGRAWRVLDTLVGAAPEGERPFRRAQGQVLVAAAVGRAGLADSARHMLGRIDVSQDADPTRDINMDKAFAWTLIGDKGAAVRELKTFLAANPGHGNSLGDDHGWRFRALRDDPRFQTLVQGDKPST